MTNPTETEVEAETTVEQGCNCENPMKLEPCPIHDKELVEKQNTNALHPVQIDVHVHNRAVSHGLTEWGGVSFTCGNCNNASIMHWFKACPECGAKLNWTFDRKPIFDYIESIKNKPGMR